MTLGIASYASAAKSKNEKVGYDRRQSFKTNKYEAIKKEFGKRFGYFKCFRGANTKQQNYSIVPTSVDETPQTVVI